MTFQIKRNDTRVNLKATLSNESGPVNLTGCTVRFFMAPYLKNGLKIINREAQIVDAPQGIVWFVFEDGDTRETGLYKAELQVTFPDGRRETFPNTGYIAIEIQSDLG